MKKALPALLAALLFGASTPAAKLLIGEVTPLTLAGLLYFGSGLGLATFVLLRFFWQNHPGPLFSLKPGEKIYFAGAVLFGGILAPVLLLIGLSKASASTTSLLLNLEGAFTATLACLVFKEHYGRRLVLGMIFILVGGALLSVASGFHLSSGILGSGFIAAACLGWAVDNNLTRKVESLDATTLAAAKGSIAGIVNLTLALIVGQKFPNLASSVGSMALGLVGYGISLVFFVVSLRKIGTARTSAYFSTAPFVGAILSVFLFAEPVTLVLVSAGLLMAVGVWLHLTEKHTHSHRHEPIGHEHPHTHDEHHQHEHSHADPLGVTHSHWHQHTRLEHHHPHAHDDLHHQHEH